ncbi:Glyoxalase family protein [Carnobacterium maltaromaticum]|uniref:VOC family protein n=1 Tax=Carnobacterium maltaromaticum TaxID=2751 RepID=UPI00191BA114|nr:VOC family protein [Carnobacterium maltaromaticum]CAD5896388.1 Glyoxalase family protein [Carnobacterium maltaromaticum]
MKKMNSETRIGKVVLNVENLEAMKTFYQDKIGLEIKSETENEVSLGAVDESQTTLLQLKRVPITAKVGRRTGLYHTAFLLPSRSALGDVLYHLVKTEYPITGASDHGYSEAIYLDDPEGNGIEIYHDKAREVWDINPDGTINGITIAMDAEGVLGAATGSFTGLPKGTTVGHIHLTVADLDATEKFYIDTLKMNLQTDFPGQAKFIAAGNYHHHIGTNVWSGRNIPPMEKDTKGLAYFTMEVPSLEALLEVKDNLDEKSYPYEYDEKHFSLRMLDPNGINLEITVK